MQNKLLIYEEETYAIRGAVFEVYKEMSNGAFLKRCIRNALRESFWLKISLLYLSRN